MKLVNIVIADTHPLTRYGVEHLLQSHPNYKVVASVDNRNDLFLKLIEHQPDLVIIDYNNTNHFSITDLSEIHQYSAPTKILVISTDKVRENIFKAIDQGTCGFLTKECDGEEILEAIEASSKGEKFYCNKIIEIILQQAVAKEEENCKPSNLTAREIEIIRHIASGDSTQDIAEKLLLSVHTIYTHRKNILKKLKVKSATELVIFAVNEGIVNAER